MSNSTAQTNAPERYAAYVTSGSVAEILYPNMKAIQDDISYVRPMNMSEEEFTLRQLYPSMFSGDTWFAKFYAQEKDYWD